MKIYDAKFWSKVQRDYNPYGCWYWLGTQDGDGYGRVTRKAISASSLRTHKYSFYLFHGRWPEGPCCHSCGNKDCVRPSHLYDDLMRPAPGKTDYEMYTIVGDTQKRYAKGSRINGLSALAREYGLSRRRMLNIMQ